MPRGGRRWPLLRAPARPRATRALHLVTAEGLLLRVEALRREELRGAHLEQGAPQGASRRDREPAHGAFLHGRDSVTTPSAATLTIHEQGASDTERIAMDHGRVAFRTAVVMRHG